MSYNWSPEMAKLIGRTAGQLLRAKFARENGWKVSRAPFGLNALAAGRRLRRYSGPVGGIAFDHPEFFIRDRQPVAIIVHNYNDLLPPSHPDVRWVRLPESWYYPGHTVAYLATRIIPEAP